MPINPPVRVASQALRSAVAARWREAAKLDASPFGYEDRESGLRAWRSFFATAAESKFLTGRKDPAPGRETSFRADLGWLMQAKNFANVCNNKYFDRAVA